MEIVPTAIPDVLRLRPDRHGDERGFFSETYRREWFAAIGIDPIFVQDNHSFSATRATVRGLHFQVPPADQGKLVRCPRGRLLDVVVDIRHGSASFGRHVAVELSAENWEQLWVPAGFAHGFVTLEPDTELVYKVTSVYSAEHDRGLAWDDPELAIDWQIDHDEAVLSARDRVHPKLADLPAYFEMEAGDGA